MLPYLYIGSAKLPLYGLFSALGIIVSFSLAYGRLKQNGGTGDALFLVAAASMAFALIGAKIAYFLSSYGMARLIREALAGDFSGLNDSGMVYYGGLIGGIAGAVAAVRLSDLDFDLYAGAIVPCIPLGHAFGRVGCLFAGCCYGVPYDGVCAVHSVYAAAEQSLFPVQAVEALLNIALFIAFVIFCGTKRKGAHTLCFYLIAYSAIRFAVEFFRGDLIRGVYHGISTSQWISAGLIACSVLLLIVGKKRSPIAAKGRQRGG